MIDTFPARSMFSVIKDYYLPLSAIYGAVLSTYNTWQALRKERRKIKVSVSEHNEPGEPFRFAKIEATNTGHRAVTVKSLSFELPTGSRLEATASEEFSTPSGTPLPAPLPDGQSAYIYISCLYIACTLDKNRNRKIELIPICEDSVGGIHKGSPWAVDLDKLVPLS